MNTLIDHQISKIFSILTKIEEHVEIIQPLLVFYHGIGKRKNNEFYVMHMLDRVEHLHGMFDVSTLVENKHWIEYNKCVTDLTNLLEHLMFDKRRFVNANGDPISSTELKSKELVNEYYLKQELCYGKELRIKEIIPMSYNVGKDKLEKLILYKDLIDIDKHDYYDENIKQKYISPVFIIGSIDGKNTYLKTPIVIWNELIELIKRIIRFEEKKGINVLPTTIFIDTENKWIDTIREMTLLIKRKIK